MILYHCLLTLHDNVFFATREMGILYETEKYLHNWALSYALFKVAYIPQLYRLQGQGAQKPNYFEVGKEQSLAHLNDAKIYVFPAKPLQWSYQINTFKAAQTTYYGKSKQFGDKGADRNYPINYGRAKELAIGSQYSTFILTENEIEVPYWIRLGKWAAKIKVKTVLLPSSLLQSKSGEYNCEHPLNPLDLSPHTQLLLYNRIVMPPSSLISQAQLQGEFWKLSGESWNNFRQNYSHLPQQVYLPKGVYYGAGCIANAS